MTSPDMTASIVPNSAQLNADEFVSGPRVFTVERVTAGSAEQPVEIHMAGFPGRPFKPSKTVRRIIVAAWGTDSAAYIGRQMKLYRDPEVMFGKDKVGGIRIEAMSDIDKPISLALSVTRGKRAMFTVKPLPPMPAEIIAAEHRIAEAADLPTLDGIAAELKAMNLGEHKGRLLQAWSARQAALKAAPVAEPAPAPESGDEYGDLLDAAAGGEA